MLEPFPNDYWYTPPYVIDCIKAFMPGYFDPCPVNPLNDGLKIEWKQDAFINPPYSRKLRRDFVEKGSAEYKGGRYLWLLNFGNNVDHWTLHQKASAVCIPATRIRFIPGHPALGDGKSPMYDSIFILWGDPAGFKQAFAPIGKVYQL